MRLSTCIAGRGRTGSGIWKTPRTIWRRYDPLRTPASPGMSLDPLHKVNAWLFLALYKICSKFGIPRGRQKLDRTSKLVICLLGRQSQQWHQEIEGFPASGCRYCRYAAKITSDTSSLLVSQGHSVMYVQALIAEVEVNAKLSTRCKTDRKADDAVYCTIYTYTVRTRTCSSRDSYGWVHASMDGWMDESDWFRPALADPIWPPEQ